MFFYKVNYCVQNKKKILKRTCNIDDQLITIYKRRIRKVFFILKKLFHF